MDRKRLVKVIVDLLLVGLVAYILYSILKDRSLAEYGGALFRLVTLIIGLCLLIFFHELGHFLAAKACNVRVETFSIGFGPPIPRCEFRYGETYYKIGRFPLGGYVKMLGQTDPGEKEEDEVAAREDPRSYMNKTVGQRMIIISAGVIMNVLLGMACFTYVYLAGKVEKVPRFGTIEPGSPAERAGLEPGSKILAVDDNTEPIYEDLYVAGLLAKPGSTEVYLKWQTPRGEVHDAKVIPIRAANDFKPRMGVGFPIGLQVVRGEKDPAALAAPQSPAERAGFQSGDKLVAVRPKEQAAFTPLENGWDLIRAEEKWRDQTLVFQVKRDDQETSVTVEPAHFWSTGMYLTMGPIRTMPEDDFAPKSAYQFQKGDLIVAINGDRRFDPLRLPDLMRDQAERGEDVKLTVVRNGREQEIAIPHADLAGRGTWLEMPPSESLASMGIPALGLSYDVKPIVSFVQPDSPAAAAGLQPGDELVSAVLQPIKDGDRKSYKLSKVNWSAIFWTLQGSDLEKKVELTYLRGGVEKSVTLNLQLDKSWPLASRGMRLEFETKTFTASSFSGAIQLGFRETYRWIIRMYMSLKSLVSGDVSMGTVSGPVGIATISYKTLEQGFTEFVLFLGIISINLAVVNFLPIPILDGGHMVFLLWEKIRGKPAGERAMAVANTIGLVVILSLLCFVLFLDLGGRKLFFGD